MHGVTHVLADIGVISIIVLVRNVNTASPLYQLVKIGVSLAGDVEHRFGHFVVRLMKLVVVMSQVFRSAGVGVDVTTRETKLVCSTTECDIVTVSRGRPVAL